MVKKAMSMSSDTLPFKDHSATDRKGVPLDFTPLRHFLHRYLLEVCSLLVLHTGDPSFPEFSFHFTLFVLTLLRQARVPARSTARLDHAREKYTS